MRLEFKKQMAFWKGTTICFTICFQNALIRANLIGNRHLESQGLRVQLPRKNHAAREREGRVRRRGVAEAHRHTRRAEAADTAASGEGAGQAGKLVYCVEGAPCFQQASPLSTFAEPAVLRLSTGSRKKTEGGSRGLV